MTYQPASNPWDVANNPPEQTREVSGAVTINAWWCMLVPGQGKQPYDEKTLDPKTGNAPRKYTAIDLTIEPLVESGMTFPVQRTMLAEFGEWKDVTLPSLRDIGFLDASQLNGKYARIELVPTGRKYTNSQGEEKEASAVKFVAVYDTREQCLAAMNGDNPTSPTPVAAAPVPSNGNGNAEKETALKFAKAFVANAMRQAGGDLDKARGILAPMIANQPVISKHYTVDSPEIVALMAESLS
jgi:hypothetical protein